nr:replication-associated protein [Grapevine virus P]
MSISVSSQRAAAANLYSNCSEIELLSIKTLKSKRLLKAEEGSDGLFDYYVDEFMRDFLGARGISFSVHSFQAHPHPVSKMIENYFLYKLVPSYCSDKTLIISCKESKVKNIFIRAQKMDVKCEIYNRIVHAKDYFRYERAHRDLDLGSLTNAVDKFEKADTIFIHDEVHYWSLGEFQSFLGQLKPETRLIYSIIYPAEIHCGYDHSVLPEAYTFKLNGNCFTWFPDGSCEGAYVQPVNEWLLSTFKTLDTQGRTWTINKLQSMGAHHLFSCTPGSTVTEQEYYYGDSSVMDPCDVLKGRRTREPLYLRVRMIRPTLLYLMALKKPDSNSAVAKLRMLSNGSENMNEALFVAQLAKQFKDTNLYDKMGNFRVREALTQALCSALGPMVSYLTLKEELESQRLEHFITRCEPIKVCIKRRFRDLVVRPSGKLSGTLSSWSGNPETEWDVLDNYHEKMEEYPGLYYGSEVLTEEDRRSNRAIMYVHLARREWAENRPSEAGFNKVVLIASSDTLKKWLSTYMIKLGTYRYMTSRALSCTSDPAEAFEQGTISEELFNLLMGFRAVVSSPVVQKEEEKDMGPHCCCGLPLPLKQNAIKDLKEELLGLECPDKLKGRKAGFYSRKSEEYRYNGGAHLSLGWPKILDQCRDALGMGEDFDHCLVQIYENGSSIGLHRDDEPCYLPGCEVVTVNLTGTAKFTLECSDKKKTELILSPGDVLTMPPGFQENHRHGVTSLDKGRMSLTFRNKTVDYECEMDEEEEYSEGSADLDECLEKLSANKANLCCLEAIAEHISVPVPNLAAEIAAKNPRYLSEIEKGGLTLCSLIQLAGSLRIPLEISARRGGISTKGEFKKLGLAVEGDHVRKVEPTKGSFSLVENFLASETVGECSFRFDVARAQRVSESFHLGMSGKILNRFKAGKVGVVGDGFECRVLTCFGFAGSGKSYWIQTVLKQSKKDKVMVISPRRALADDWSKKVGPDLKVYTFEMALMTEMLVDCLVIDEIGLLPPGYIDLAALHFRPQCLVLLGDPLQSSYYNKDDAIQLAPINENPFSRCIGEVPYLMYSHRLPSDSEIFQVTSYGNKSGGQIARNLKPKGPTICAARATKEALKTEAYTIGETQGLSFDWVNLQLDKDWAKVDDGGIIVAFSRSRGTVNLLFEERVKEYLVQHSKSRVLKSILKGERVSKGVLLNVLKTSLPQVVLFEQECRLANSEAYEERMSGDPYLKGLLNFLEEVEMEEPELDEPYPKEEMRTHLPLSNFLNDCEPIELKAKERREAYTDRGRSEQIDEMGYRGCDEYPATHKALYLRHNSDDTATFFMSVKKRLRFRDPEKNRRLYNKVKGCGKQMFARLREVYALGDLESLPALDACEADFIKKRMLKSQKLIEKHSYRSEVEWPSNYLKIFLKQQTCTKLEKRGIDAKAGQTIACFCHSVLVRFGPILRQSEKKLKELLPENVMIYSQKNYNDLDEWCKTYVNTMMGTDSDYEAFDRSQDEKILDLEVEALRYFLWPEELINEYVELKLMMGCSLGSLAVMRFSGEFGTFFFNTLCNMVFTCLRYNITRKTPICFAGDDMYAPGVLQVSKVYEEILNGLELKAKVNVSTQPLFCGWRMSPFGIVKEPRLILDRWKIAVGNNSIDDCRVNYAIEASFGYRLSDYLFDVNIDLDAQQELVRLIVKDKKKLPHSVARLFSDEECEAWSDGEKNFIRADDPDESE